ncbi:membrane-bound O-acyltransferase family protein [Polaribacter sejongensis]|uniref:Membrane-bound O-acyltransferase family protein n=1 Tax=Polaribacter sejongensis TaxID=985043 RepID=A0ABM6PZZ4_9FLAO|nr:MBOAT family O-acyltransferase [Polaribacter sejongensis]AUC22341.1 membrane-bound O-acyltransferase family protein [Polaribacter sejongensis]
MLFNSIEFLLFLPAVFFLYWLILKKIELQNGLILIASYVFYGWWDWRFLSLILLSTIVDYTLALRLKKNKNNLQRKYLLWTSIIFNIGLLGYFKYYNFFIDNWIQLWATFDIKMHESSLNIILPVGISFYTFQTLSYTIDVYRNKLEPTKNFIAFASFVSFFPQLVAGPIERASNLLPQFFIKRKFEYQLAKSGIKLILWGMFKKIVIADNCAIYANDIFSNYNELSGVTLILGAIYFSFQIYCDFSGYSDIAIGTARLFGFKLMRNFNYPYFSRDIAEFWRRWHISLSTWFRDYLYIPLGGSKGSKFQQIRNVFVIFLVSGFWHGANWTFVVWGGLNALFFLPLLLTNNNRKNLNITSENKLFPSIKELGQIVFTFTLTTLAWVFFRSETITDALNYLRLVFSNETFLKLNYLSTIERFSFEIIFLLPILLIYEWFYRKEETPFNGKFQLINETIILLLLLVFGIYSNYSNFIYFQF